MNQRRLNKIREKIRSLQRRAGNVHRREYVGVAKSLGRREFDRGKEPTYVSEPFPDLPPITIPAHRVLKKGTSLRILQQLDEDVFRWQDKIDEADDAEEDDDE